MGGGAMILGPISTENPFADPHLIWCEAGFVVADVQGLTHLGALGPLTLALPDDLLDDAAPAEPAAVATDTDHSTDEAAP